MWSPSNPPQLTIYCGGESPRMSGQTECQYEFMLHGQALNVRGRRLDVVCAVSQPWKTDASTNKLGDSPRQTGQYISSLLGCIGSWANVVQGWSDYLHDKAATQVLIKMLAQDAPFPLSADHHETLVRYLSTWVTSSKSDDDSRHITLAALADLPDSPMGHVHIGDYIIGRELWLAIGKISLGHWKTGFRTLNGFLGLRTHTVQDGDVVAVFHGCSRAAVLRPSEGWLRYVGPAYVDRIMNGEFWEQSLLQMMSGLSWSDRTIWAEVDLGLHLCPETVAIHS